MGDGVLMMGNVDTWRTHDAISKMMYLLSTVFALHKCSDDHVRRGKKSRNYYNFITILVSDQDK